MKSTRKIIKQALLLAIGLAFVSSEVMAQNFAENFVVQQFQRRLQVGMGKAPSIGTVRYPQAIKNGETIVMFADGLDADGDDVFVEWYIQGRLFTIQSERPYGIRVGPDFYGSTPVRVTVAVRNDYGDASVAKLAITSAAFSKTYECDFTSSDTATTVTEATATQTGNTGVQISFTGSDSTTDKEVKVLSPLVISGTNATGTLTLTKDSSTQLFNVTGSVTFLSDGLTIESISVEDKDAGASLSCD